MGLVIVTVVGAVLGWLASIIVERDDRVGAAVCALAGTAGAVAGAMLAGDVPLAVGVSPVQLLWATMGAVAAIVAINAAVVSRLGVKAEVFDNPVRPRQHLQPPVYNKGK